MVSDNTSPRAGTRTAEATDGTQPLEPVSAPDAGSTNGSRAPRATTSAPAPAKASPAAAKASQAAAKPAPATEDAPGPEAGTTDQVAGTGSSSSSATSSVKDGAVKAAAAALAAARTAAKKVQSTASSASAATGGSAGTRPNAAASSTPPPPDATQSAPRPEMHYSAGGVHGSAQTASPDQGAYATQPEPSAEQLGSPRRVRLSVSRIDPWSIMKLAFLLSVAIAIMTVVATIVVWYSLNSLETFATIQEFMTDTLGPQAANLTQFVAFERVVSLATLIALVNIVLMTAIATIMTMLYNITAALVGGVHLTLTDE
jgi:hypothetical protein